MRHHLTTTEGTGKARTGAGTIYPAMSEIAAPPPSAAGCLTDAQIAEIRSAAPGTLAEPLARHLAGCERCQERLLFGQERRTQRRARPRPEFPTLRRLVLLLVLVLVAIAAFFYTLRKLVGGP
jgi:hypothetical protein